MSGYQPVKLAYDKVEPDGDPDSSLSPMIFLHAITHSRQSWKNVPKEIANATKRTAYVVDSRNHGDSEWSDDYSFEIDAQDLLHFIDKLGISKAVLVGHSAGALTAMRVALTQPGVVDRLIIEDMGLKKITKEDLKGNAWSVALAQKALESVTPEMDESEAKKTMTDYMVAMFADKVKVQPEDIVQSLSIKRNNDGNWTFKANVKVIENKSQTGEMGVVELEGTYEGPACFIYGTASPMNVSAQLDGIKKSFPNAEIVAIESSNHGLHIAKKEEFVDAVTKFLL